MPNIFAQIPGVPGYQAPGTQSQYQRAYQEASRQFSKSRGRVAGYSSDTFRLRDNEFNQTLFRNLGQQYAQAQAARFNIPAPPPPQPSPAPAPAPAPAVPQPIQEQRAIRDQAQDTTQKALEDLRKQQEQLTADLTKRYQDLLAQEKARFGSLESRFNTYQQDFNPGVLSQQLAQQQQQLQERFAQDLSSRLGLQRQDLTDAFNQRLGLQEQQFQGQLSTQQRQQELANQQQQNLFNQQLAAQEQARQQALAEQQSAFESRMGMQQEQYRQDLETRAREQAAREETLRGSFDSQLAKQAEQFAGRERDLTTELGTIRALTEAQESRLGQLTQEREKSNLRLNEQLRRQAEGTTAEQQARTKSKGVLQQLLGYAGIYRPSNAPGQNVNTLTSLLR